METILIVWTVFSIIPTLLFLFSLVKDPEKQWYLLKVWLIIEFIILIISIPVALIILLFNFLEK
jgi:hypothetical protein